MALAGQAAVKLRARKGKPLGTVLPGAVLAGLLVSAGFFAAAALIGGQIRHDEIHARAPVVTQAAPKERD